MGNRPYYFLTTLQNFGVPQELIDHIDNLRPMNWENNLRKSDDFPNYAGKVVFDGINNAVVERDYRVRFYVVLRLKNLYQAYIDIKLPSTLDRYLSEIAAENTDINRKDNSYFDEIKTISHHDLD